MLKGRLSTSFLLVMLAGSLVLSACSPKYDIPKLEPVATSVQETLETAKTPVSPVVFPTSTEEKPPTPISRSSPENRTHYLLNISLNYYSHVADVTETITYNNRSSTALTEIVLAIPPENYPDSYRQQTLTGPLLANFYEEGQITKITLSQPLEPGSQTQFDLKFRLVLPDSKGTYGVVGRQTNLFNWYPYIPPHDEEKGWTVHPMVVINGEQIGEYVVSEVADFDVNLKLTDRANLIEVAASAPAVGEAKSGNYSYHLEMARSFAFSVCDSFFEEEVEHNGVRIRTYLFFNEVDQAQRILKIATQALDLYGELWMPYPRKMLSIVAADFLHNMEMDGMVMLSYGVIDNAKVERESMLDYLVPHEIAHQWFYSLVHNDQAAEPWLDEALATYSESLFYERYYPDLLAWWWTNRVDKYTLAGFVDMQTSESTGYDSYRDAVYLRGAQFLRDLRLFIGDQTFFASLKDYFQSNLNRIANAKAFFGVIQYHSNKDLKPLIAQYFKKQP